VTTPANRFADAGAIWDGIAGRAFSDLWSPQTATEWCKENYRLSPEVTSVEGRFDPTPYQAAMLDMFTMDGGPEVVCLLKASRVGYSAVMVGSALYLVSRVKRHLIIYLPSDGDAKSFGKDTLAPAFRDCPVTADLMEDVGVAKRSAITHQYTVLGGKTVRILGAVSKARFKRISADVVFLDETDSLPGDVGGEGSPVSLAHRAVVNSPFRRQLIGGKPGDESTSIIWREYQSCALRLTYHCACPHCGELTDMAWRNFVFADGDGTGRDVDARAESVQYASPCCGGLWRQTELPAALAAGAWVSPASDDEAVPNPYEGWRVQTAPDAPPMLLDEHGAPQDWPHRVGLYVWAAHSPLSGWDRIVRQWLEAQGDVVKLKAWTNEVHGLPWRDVATHVDENELLAQRRPMLPLPGRFTRITAAVDIQDGWLSCLVVAWAEGEECALIERREWHGDIDRVDAQGWLDLNEWLAGNPAWPVEGIGLLGLSAVVLDSSWMTDVAYRMARRLRHRRVFVIKGSKEASAPIIRRPPSRVRAGDNVRLPLFMLGTHQAKQVLVGRMAGAVDGAPVHYHDGLPEEVFAELGAERLITKRERGSIKRQWTKIRARNEALDCLVYCLAAIRLINPPYWDRPERAAVVKADEDAKAAADAPPPKPVHSSKIWTTGGKRKVRRRTMRRF